MKILKEAYTYWDAEGKLVRRGKTHANYPFEVVFITSNYIGNSEIMEGCKEANIPCFGTLWDFVSVTYFQYHNNINNCFSERHWFLPTTYIYRVTNQRRLTLAIDLSTHPYLLTLILDVDATLYQ